MIRFAADEAARSGRDRIGDEHLLLGVIATGAGVGAAILRRAGVTLESARSELTTPPADGRAASAPTPPLTPEARAAVEWSMREALDQGGGPVTPDHILLGLLRPDDSLTATVLRELGINPDDLIHQILVGGR